MPQVLASLGLLVTLLVALHWWLDVLQAGGRLRGAAARRVYELMDGWMSPLDPQRAERHAERRRQARLEIARQHREAIARVSQPGDLDDEAVTWEGNVARPKKFGSGPHNLH